MPHEQDVRGLFQKGRSDFLTLPRTGFAAGAAVVFGGSHW